MKTVNHAVEIKGNLIGRTTAIRILAANITHQIAFTETNFVNSLMTERKVYLGDDNWSPQLVSMVRSDTSTGILTTITWPSIPEEFGPNEYEVSWNAVGDPMEVTGHLQTTENKAVLTLWPDSVYLVTVDRYTSDGIIYGDTTQALVINTKKYTNGTLIEASSPLCNLDDTIHASHFTYVLLFLAVLVMILALSYIIRKAQRQIMEDDRKKTIQASIIFEKADKIRQKLLHNSIQNGVSISCVHKPSTQNNANTKAVQGRPELTLSV